MKKVIKRLICGIVVIVTIWGCVVAVDYTRARFNKNPLFSISKGYIEDGGTVDYYGIGYTVIHYDQMPENGGRTDIVFKFESPSPRIFRDWFNKFGLDIIKILIPPLVPTIIAYFFFKFKSKLLFLVPAMSVIAIFFILVFACAIEDAEYFKTGEWIDIIINQGWLYGLITLLCAILITVYFCFLKSKHRGTEEKHKKA